MTLVGSEILRMRRDGAQWNMLFGVEMRSWGVLRIERRRYKSELFTEILHP